MQIQRINNQNNDTEELYFISSLLNKTECDLPKGEQTYWYPARTTPVICNKGGKRAYGGVEYGLFSGLNISLASVVKIGLSFIPGGQLIALAVSVSETAYGYATGAIQGLGGLLNVATSAIGAGASWLGETVGKAATSFIGGVGKVAKTVANVAGKVVKNVVGAVGNVVNRGFKVKSDGSLDWSMNKKEWKSSWTDAGKSFVMDSTGDIAGGLTDIAGIGDAAIGDMSISGMAKSFTSEAINYAYNDEFNVTLMNTAYLMDRGRGGDCWGDGFMGQFGRNMYMSDKDVSEFRGFGLGVTFSKDGQPDWNTKAAGGFDLSGLTYAAVTDPTRLANDLYKAGKGIAKGLGAIGKGVYNLAQNTLFDREQDRQRNESDRSYPEEQTPLLYAGKEEDERKGKKFSQKEKDELKDYYKKAYNLDDDKAQTLINALERGYIAQGNDKQYAEAGVSDVELHKKQLRITNTKSGEPLNKRSLSTTNETEKDEILTTSSSSIPQLEISKTISDLSSQDKSEKILLSSTESQKDNKEYNNTISDNNREELKGNPKSIGEILLWKTVDFFKSLAKNFFSRDEGEVLTPNKVLEFQKRVVIKSNDNGFMTIQTQQYLEKIGNNADVDEVAFTGKNTHAWHPISKKYQISSTNEFLKKLRKRYKKR